MEYTQEQFERDMEEVNAILEQLLKEAKELVQESQAEVIRLRKERDYLQRLVEKEHIKNY